MGDQEFLVWLHDRLEFVHGEDPHYDYMHKLRVIILSTDPSKITPNMGSGNGLSDVLSKLEVAPK